jgi:hypothetical protein
MKQSARMTCEEVAAEWGERCSDFDPACPVCKAWSSWDLSKPRNIADESALDDAMDLILKRNPDFSTAIDAVINRKAL